jgi:hypothetical protein
MTFVHILRPGARFYSAMVRRAGYRKWETVADTKSRRKAFRAAADALESGKYKRAVILQWPVYGDPAPFTIAEMKQ